MKTQLPQSINSIEEAKAFLAALHSNNEQFHPEDDAHEIEWLTIEDENNCPTVSECDQLNKLMNDIYNLPGNNDAQNMAFDPCGYLLDLAKNFLVRDKTGRGYTAKPTLADLKEWDEVQDDEELIEWLSECEVGDHREERTLSITRID